ncbi:hypothetical protein [Streptomyces sp. NBC_01187]|uniref:hypothetical protein n=1 Tax=Streptomyces sp. NBC_01187 TaxID=2903766 RepID=UPI003867A2D6|nr:hypothetical protein OG220_11630 [Streptomyces sp. NBC_01187]
MDHSNGTKHRVRITARGPKAKIEIDGQRIDPGALTTYTISHQAGEPPHLILDSEDPASIVFDGLARVAVADVPDPGPAAAIFLDAIDAEELERAALARPDLGTGPHSLTQAMLTQLGEWARGL